MSSSGQRPSVSRSSEVERIIAAAEVDTTFAGKKAIRYRGRRSTWPGALALALVVLGSIVGLVFYGINLHNDVIERNKTSGASAQVYGLGTWIDDGSSLAANQSTDIDVVNPAEYSDPGCSWPTYLSQSGRIIADYGTKQVPMSIKGVNWLGMQDNRGVPKGLWDNTREGNSIYRIAKFLVDNKFNMVRLPLSIDSVFRNVEVDETLINTNSNRALEATRYVEQLGLVIQGLGRLGLGVVLDFHVLSAVTTDDNSLWYGSSIHLDDIKTAITNLATKLCSAKYYNIVGLDLKDGVGSTATWGDGGETDWATAATTLGNHMLSKCPNWLAFVQGIQGSSHKDVFGSRTIKWKFYAGSDLTGAASSPIKLSKANKLVYSPKYWSSSVLPHQFFFDSGTVAGDQLQEYVESDNATLSTNVLRSMELMFGSALNSSAAVVLSSFGGLTGSEDLTAKKTSTRVVEIVIKKMLASTQSLAGGFWWTLNPDTYWSFPLPDSDNSTNSGLVDSTWRQANLNQLPILKQMDSMPYLTPLQCTPA